MSPRALANQQRQEQARRMSKLGRSLLLLIATVLSFGTIGLLAADQLYRPDTFVVDQLKIKGNFRYLNPKSIEAVVKQEAVGNFFSIKLTSIKRRVEALEWVQTAEVRREWPNTLLIDVSEQRPVMRWNKDKWVNSLGQVVDLPRAPEISNPIVLVGNERDSELMLHKAYRWKKQIERSGLELREVSLSGSHAWRLTINYPLDNYQFDVLLGRDEADQRLWRFLYLFDGEFRGADKQLRRVDARYPNGLAIDAVALTTTESIVMEQSTERPL